MANIKITELNAASSLAATDVVPVVDVSADETKKITATDLFRTLPDGTAAAPALAFSSDAANGVYLAGTDTVGISTGGTQRVTVDGSGNVTISGDLQVDGATTTVQSTTVTIDDKNIELGSVATPTNTTADGGGITLKGATDKTLKWIDSTGCWTFNQPMNFNDHVRIDSSGNLGIGVASPVSLLHARGASGAAPYFYLDAGSTAAIFGINDGATKQVYLGSVTNAPVLFRQNNTERMRIDASGRVKIGLTSTVNKFHVKETNTNTIVGVLESSAAYSYQSLQASGTTAGAVRVGANANDFVVNAGSAERLRIDSNGRVGIGTSSADRLLHLAGADTAIIRLENTDASLTADQIIGGLEFEKTDGSGAGAGVVGGLRMYSEGAVGESAYLTLSTASSSTNDVERLRIDSSGNVGIGETSIDRRLHVRKDGAAAAKFGGEGGGGDYAIEIGQLSATSSPGFNATGGGSMLFKMGGTEAMRINSSRKVGIGTTSIDRLLHVQGAGTSGTQAQIEGTLASAGIKFVPASGDNWEVQATTSSDFIVYNRTDNAQRLTIDTSGQVGIGVASPGCELEIGGSGHIHLADQGRVGCNSGSGAPSDAYIKFFDTDIVTINTTDTERLRIDSSGRLLVGASSVANAGIGQRLYVAQTGGESIANIRYGNNANPSYFLLGKSRSTSVNNYTVLQSGDEIGRIQFAGADGTDLANFAASISCFVDATPGSDDMPGRLVFKTRGDGANSETERLRITSTGAWAIEGASNYGTSGQVLTSNGNDSPTWQDAAGGGSTDSISEGNTSVECVDTGSNGHITLDTEGSERIRVDNAGNVGINETSPATTGFGATLRIKGISGAGGLFAEGSSGAAWFGFYSGNSTGDTPAVLYPYNGGLRIGTTNSVGTSGFAERARFDSSGRLLVGTSSARANFLNASTTALSQVEGSGTGSSRGIFSVINNATAEYPATLLLGRSNADTVGSNTLVGNNDWCGRLGFMGNDGSEFVELASISGLVDGTPGANDMPGRLSFRTTADGAASPTERFRINSQGRLSGGDALNPTGDADAKFLTINANYNGNTAVNITGTSGNTSQSGTYALRLRQNVDNNQGNSAILRIDHTNPAGASGGEIVQVFSNRGNSTAQKVWVLHREGNQSINRPANDGVLISFRQNDTQEGTISVSGSSVSYNGGHLARWSQLEGGAERTEILRGSVLSNLDEMCEWIKPDTEELLWTQEDLDMYLLNGDEGLPGGAQVGDVKEPATSGVRENNEQLNRMKVSDVEGDVNVAGVFQEWDDDDDIHTNDFYCAMTGDFVIRIAQGTTVTRGDLLMSAGDGTAKPQDDDIVRSKTIAKVTSTTVSTTYADGSYCVPCVLMAC